MSRAFAGVVSVTRSILAACPPEARQRSVQEIVADVDREVDTVMAHFRIERKWIRKQLIPIPNAEISRTERRIMIPPDVLPVQMNQALNSMARRYHGRAIASENLKENSVTIHIELEGYIVETIILRPSPELRPAGAARPPNVNPPCLPRRRRGRTPARGRAA